VDSEYTVTGMTCGHCAQTVSGELDKLPGVQAVEGVRNPRQV
jgi:copper chaperone CopZ